MIINKQLTKYGYNANIRFDVKTPKIHVIQPGMTFLLNGEADITVITGQMSIRRIIDGQEVYTMLHEGETSRIQSQQSSTITAKTKTVMMEDNKTSDTIQDYLDLTVKEDEPSSDDLEYITED